jgi:hypothetical protein
MQMKKIIYSIAILTVFCTTCNFTLVQKQASNLSSLELQNIEALSYAESDGQRCFLDGSLDCPFSKEKVKYVF